MIMSKKFLYIIVLLFYITDANHFRGGIISWRPLNNQPNGSTVNILLYQRYFWNRLWSGFSLNCTENNVVMKTIIPVNEYVKCTVNCSSSTFNTTGVSTQMITTDCDQNSLIQSWAGERYAQMTLPLTTSISISYSSSAWFGPNLYPASGKGWAVTNRINLAKRPDGRVNTSPVTNTLPVLFKPVGQQLVHIIQMADNDGGDILRCRWSNSNAGTNYNRFDECNGACFGLNGTSTLFPDNCTLLFTIPTYYTGWYIVIALQIEDYYDSSSATPMSSVPIQFLLYGYTPTGNCTTRPAIIGARPNRACIGTLINVTITENIIAQSYCNGVPIIDFVTSSPYGMQHSSIVNQGNGIYVMTITWTPDESQYGPQSVCAGAVDSKNLQSDAWCVTYLVGFDSPNLIRPQVVQGSASPIGTVFANQSIFSIEATRPVNRPNRNGTYIRFIDAANNTPVQIFDSGWQSNILYSGYSITIITNYTWAYGHTYYVTFDSGVASGTEFCGPESAPISSSNFWSFNIWDPGMSSTTTTTTTPPTTGTITTRPLGTTTPNPLLTTTGIGVHMTTTQTTTSTTSMTTTSNNTTVAGEGEGATTTSTATMTDMPIVDPLTFEEACKVPVAITIAAQTVVMCVVHAIAMFVLFLRLNNMFNPNQILPVIRHQQRLKKLQL